MEPMTMTAKAAARYIGVDYHTLLGWTVRERDPLPKYRLAGQTKYYRIKRKELEEWVERNMARVR